MLKRLFARFFLRVTGITLRGEPVDGSAVLIAAPHTSNWDFFVMLSFAWMRGIDPKWIGKKELFKGPMGPIMRALGGVSVDRSNASGVADQLADEFSTADRLVLVITPEGTRGHGEYWKSGFYRIAEAAEVPIQLCYVDWPKRDGGFGLVRPSGDVTADMDVIRDFYAGKVGIKASGTTVPRLRDETAD